MEPSTPSEVKEYPAHLKNPDLSSKLRYGWVLWWTATLALLIVSDVGSGVQALTQTVPDERLSLNFRSEKQVLLEASVFSSVAELWEAGSKPLAVFVAITSIAWPYVKLLLSLYAWVMPFRNPTRREKLLVALDLFGKWSLADVVVFIVIMVVFRERIPLGAGYLEVWIKPQWGLYGFVVASLSSLTSTHVALFHHRQIIYPVKASTLSNEETPQVLAATLQSTALRLLIPFLWLIAFVMYLMGCVLYIFEVTNTQQGVDRGTESFSVASIGKDLPDAKRDYEPAGGLIFLQLIWFILGMAVPISLLGVLAFLWCRPHTKAGMRWWLTAGEIAFAWSAGEVLVISVVLAIREIPTFADGLIDTGCSQCYVVDSEFLALPVTLWVMGTVGTAIVASTVLTTAHQNAYSVPALLLDGKTTDNQNDGVGVEVVEDEAPSS